MFNQWTYTDEFNAQLAVSSAAKSDIQIAVVRRTEIMDNDLNERMVHILVIDRSQIRQFRHASTAPAHCGETLYFMELGTVDIVDIDGTSLV
jgi:hypothetical protein